MGWIFSLLRKRLSDRSAYNIGFGIYWCLWCGVVPTLLVGQHGLRQMFRRPRRGLSTKAALTLVVPPSGAISTELLPNIAGTDLAVRGLSLATGMINATGEEILWRGLFQERYPDNLWLGQLYPLTGFVLWHLAPQIILPYRKGRWNFLVGAAIVGSCLAVAGREQDSIRWTTLAHVLTDAAGIRVASYRLGRSGPSQQVDACARSG